MSWRELLGPRWRLVEADLAEFYGADFEAPGDLLGSRSWHWFEVRVEGLLRRPDTRVLTFYRDRATAEREAAEDRESA